MFWLIDIRFQLAYSLNYKSTASAPQYTSFQTLSLSTVTELFPPPLSFHSSFFVLTSQHCPISIHSTYHISTLVILHSHHITSDHSIFSISLQMPDGTSLKLNFLPLDLPLIVPLKPILVVSCIGTADYLLLFWSPPQGGFKSVWTMPPRHSADSHPEDLCFEIIRALSDPSASSDTSRLDTASATPNVTQQLLLPTGETCFDIPEAHTHIIPEGSDSESRYITHARSPTDSGTSPAFITNPFDASHSCNATLFDPSTLAERLDITDLQDRALWTFSVLLIMHIHYAPPLVASILNHSDTAVAAISECIMPHCLCFGHIIKQGLGWFANKSS